MVRPVSAALVVAYHCSVICSMMTHHVAVALVLMNDDFSGVFEEEGEAQGQDAQEGPLPLLRLLLHKVGLAQHRVQLQHRQLLSLPASRTHHLLTNTHVDTPEDFSMSRVLAGSVHTVVYGAVTCSL